MLSSGSNFDWRGSLASLKGGWQPARQTPEEPDLLTGIKRSRTPPSCDRELTPGVPGRRRKALRKRFRSLTEGIAHIFSSEKKTKESWSKSNSKESLHSLQQQPNRFPLNDTDDSFHGYSSDLGPSEDTRSSPIRRHASSFSSFRPPRQDWKVSDSSPVLKGRGRILTPLDRLKKAPPSPPPRRYSFWLTSADARRQLPQTDTIVNAVLSSSFANLPHHLRPPPPPPPVRFSPFPSLPQPVHSLSSTSRPRSPPPPPTFFRETSLPSDAIFKRNQNRAPLIPSPLQGPPGSCNGSVFEKTVSIILQKENCTFGFTVRGGMSPDGILRPLLVTHVRPGGPADREGSLKAGDRLVALDGRDLTSCSLTDAQIALQEVQISATLAIRYDISVMDSVRCSGSPLLVEIERTPGSSLGITLSTPPRTSLSNTYSAFHKPRFNYVVIQSIRTASIGERCGALAEGDIVSAVDGLRLDDSDGDGEDGDQTVLNEANNALRAGRSHKITLEVIPNGLRTNKRIGGTTPSSRLRSPLCPHRFSLYTCPSSAAQSRIRTDTASRNLSRFGNESVLSRGIGSTIKSSREGVGVGVGGVSESEAIRVTLVAEGRSVGLALRLALDGTSAFPIVAAVDPGGAAYKSGVICIGDRILGVNGRSVNGLGVSEVTQMMNNTRPTVIIDVEIDVADSVIPSSGTFSIKLSKRQCCLGIRVARGNHANVNDNLQEEVFIQDIVRGSSAHRSGTLQVGDRILAIDNTRVNSLTLDETRDLLEVPNDVITLKIQKDDICSDESQFITYTVQLHRHKGVLGISATGSEDPFEPIIVEAIVPGSLAAQTGAIHVGDRLLSINGVSLRGKPLSEAIRFLQGNEDTVTLKISRPKMEVGVVANGVTPDWIGFRSPPTLSVDSAVDSWGSGGIESHQNIASPLKMKTDSTPELFRSNCGSTVRRKMTTKTLASGQDSSRDEDRKSWDCSSPSSDSGQSGGTDWEKMIEDLNQISATCGLREKSILHDSNGNPISTAHSNGDLKSTTSGESSNSCMKENGLVSREPASVEPGSFTGRPSTEALNEGTYSVTYATTFHSAASSPASPESALPPPAPWHVFSLTLAKDPFYEDFGFSVSDGLYEKGVYVNRIRKGGPAHRSALLRPYDRILQVNETQTEDFDCCLTVPLIASAEDSLFLKISRTSGSPPSFQLINEDLRLNNASWLQPDDEDNMNTNSNNTVT